MHLAKYCAGIRINLLRIRYTLMNRTLYIGYLLRAGTPAFICFARDSPAHRDYLTRHQSAWPTSPSPYPNVPQTPHPLIFFQRELCSSNTASCVLVAGAPRPSGSPWWPPAPPAEPGQQDTQDFFLSSMWICQKKLNVVLCSVADPDPAGSEPLWSDSDPTKKCLKTRNKSNTLNIYFLLKNLHFLILPTNSE